jgi:hypothetical protein
MHVARRSRGSGRRFIVNVPFPPLKSLPDALGLLGSSRSPAFGGLGLSHDLCDLHGDCVSSSVVHIRSNPDYSFYAGDSFSILPYVVARPNATGYLDSWSHDRSVFVRSEDTFTVSRNETGTFPAVASVSFLSSALNSTLTVFQSVTVIQLAISPQTRLVNFTGPHGFVERNHEGSFYRNDTFRDS